MQTGCGRGAGRAGAAVSGKRRPWADYAGLKVALRPRRYTMPVETWTRRIAREANRLWRAGHTIDAIARGGGLTRRQVMDALFWADEEADP